MNGAAVPVQGKRAAEARGFLSTVRPSCATVGELLACSRGAAALDLRQDLVDYGVLGHGLAEGGIQALK